MSLRKKIEGFVWKNVELARLMSEYLGVFLKFSEEPYGNFLSGHMHDVLMKYYEVICSLLNFLAEYVSLCFNVRRLFMDLLYAVGLSDFYHRVVDEEEFLRGAEVSIVDPFFFRFQVRSTVEALVPSIDLNIEELPLDVVENGAKELEASFVLELLSDLKLQVNLWSEAVEYLKMLPIEAEVEDVEKTSEAVKRALESLKSLVRSIDKGLSKIASKMVVEREVEMLTLIEELVDGVKEFLECWRQSHEATIRYMKFMLFMVWREERKGLAKLREAISAGSVEKVFPEDLSPIDVSFAASQAMIELNEMAEYSMRQMEKVVFLEKTARIFGSSVLEKIVEDTKKRYGAFERFQQELFEDLKEIKILAEREKSES